MKIFTRFSRAKIARQYADLEAEWYAKLKASGFDDIEPYNNAMNTRLISHWHTTMQKTKQGVAGGGAEMYRLLYEWLDRARYRSRGERFMLAAKGDGFDWHEIVARFGFDTSRVRLHVNRHIRNCLRSYDLRGVHVRAEEF